MPNEFEKMQADLMNRTIDDPRLARLTESIQSNQSLLDGNFLFENKKLKETLEECLNWMSRDYSNDISRVKLVEKIIHVLGKNE